MKKLLLGVLALTSLLSSNHGEAQTTADLFDLTGDPSRVSINQNSSFVLSLRVTTDVNLTSISFKLTSPNGPNLFTVTGISYTGGAFRDPGVAASTPTLVDADGTNELGASILSGDPNPSPGTLFIANITIQNTGVALLNTDYNIQLLTPSSIVSTDDFQEIGISDSYIVQVVPEPSTIATFFAGLGLLGFGIRRRKLTNA